ncbi:hypothetical protein JCGZ_18066 [Jatropha curcas]|uniref:Protein RDM1 n=1 Tax=Jatropha curcas TaxID=180498 RepID=A0A067JVS3_JATCU|nr:protein RDM1-like [Jatropha curcas]KDP26908.1 hypothetical protein JCGZ_18066 [Jatropha curcas]
MLRPYCPLQKDHLYLTDSETESDDSCEHVQSQKRNNNGGIHVGKKTYRSKRIKIAETGRDSQPLHHPEDSDVIIIRKAEKYQQCMKQILIPASGATVSPIPFISWQGLAKSIKQKYEQPLHYLTDKLLKEWDQSREENDKLLLEDIIDPAKAETTIWVVEQFHRQCSSPQFLAKLWRSDPFYQDFVHPIIP